MENDGLWLAKGKVIVLYISIKLAFHCFLQLGDMCFSSWDITFFVMPGFQESKTVSVGQISNKFELKNPWAVASSNHYQANYISLNTQAEVSSRSRDGFHFSVLFFQQH